MRHRDSANTSVANRNEQDIVLGLEEFREFPAQLLEIGGCQPATEDGVLKSLTPPLELLGRPTQAFLVPHIVAYQIPFPFRHAVS